VVLLINVAAQLTAMVNGNADLTRAGLCRCHCQVSAFTYRAFRVWSTFLHRMSSANRQPE